ncbi:glycosyltransferase family 4 protein [Spongiactinospora sp. TRM90649]|uniref:glycosyltransferase family 4 protein n=1 Tax=Spongiactinospora sp. TRM90649 TaxID=3031114 RepID=UPI0023F6A098|nr:glycosyltransferase family 4 protein [Spongiactinospora sp. TRM90649]MDF5752020.1 glycosyltransferase family 4 protein [Spongiactinospora sp. TRM90649]
MNRLKIRYLLLHAYGMGGTIRTVITQANAMAAAGHDVELVSVVRRRERPQFAIDERVRLWALVDQRAGVQEPTLAARVARRLRGGAVPRGEFAARYFTPAVERATASWIAGLDDGVLVTTRPGLNLLSARYANRDVVRVAQEHMNLSTHRPAVRAAVLRFYDRFDAVVVLTEGDRKEYQEAIPGARVERVPNSVHSLDQPHSDHTGKIVLAAGRLYPQKGFDMLLPAWEEVVREHPDWQLRIFGTGPKKDRLRAQIERLRLYNNAFLMGRTEHFHDELTRASVFVLSSRFEGLPMVMIEAMSHALPIVSFDCPTGPADVITHGKEGLLVPPKDVQGLAEALKTVIADHGLRERMGARAAKTVTTYAPASVMPRWEALFSELSAARTRR